MEETATEATAPTAVPVPPPAPGHEAVEHAAKPEPQARGRRGLSRGPANQVPKDFAHRVAIKLTSINERELDDTIAAEKAADLVYKNLNQKEMFPYFLDVIEQLLANEETQKYAATTWTALLWHSEEHPEYREMIQSLCELVVAGHQRQDRPQWENEESGKMFSYYAFLVGESFIQMMKLNSDLYDILTDIFGIFIRYEMDQDLRKKEEEGKAKKTILGRSPRKEDPKVTTKKLYDDIVDYVSSRGDFRSDTLNQKNPNEFIIVLADRMRSTRRYIIQDIMNRYALEKKKKMEKELREREASAEEVVIIGPTFNHGLYLYWVEKRYNFKYLAVEKVRITLEVIGMMIGIMAIGLGYLGVANATLLEGGLVCGMLFGFVKFFCSRQFFLPFYPRDVTAELEQDVGVFTPVFRKMSIVQMNSFTRKQIRDPENTKLLHLLPEYVKYIFAVMPDRNDMLMTRDEVNDFMEKLELNISKFQRGK